MAAISRSATHCVAWRPGRAGGVLPKGTQLPLRLRITGPAVRTVGALLEQLHRVLVCCLASARMLLLCLACEGCAQDVKCTKYGNSKACLLVLHAAKIAVSWVGACRDSADCCGVVLHDSSLHPHL